MVRFFWTIRTLFLVAALGLLAGCGQHEHEFELLVPALPFDREVAAELTAVFEQHSAHEITLVPVPDVFETALDALEAGHGDLALASNAQPFRQGVATVMPLYPTVLHVIFRLGRDTSDPMALLRGASVHAGPVGSASRQLMMTILADLGMSEDDVTFIDDRGIPDVTVLYIPVNPDRVAAAVREIGAEGELQMLGFGVPEDIGTGSEIDRSLLLNPRLAPFIVPVGTYGDMTPEPIVTLAVDKLLVASPNIPNAEIYDLINEIRRLQPALSATRPMLFQGLSEEFDGSDSTFVLHPGAQAFVQRDAPDIYERYSGVAEVLVTLLIGLVSGIYAVMKIYHRRRKNRIDVFYTNVMAVRDSITKDSSMADREAAAVKVKELQNDAFDMLVREKLAADESFRIFVTLSKDIIAELGQVKR